jgi:hypothetical protein
VVTQNSRGQLRPDTDEINLVAAEAPVGEVLRRCQDLGSDEGYNWVIDTDGSVYELAGWDRSAVGYPDGYAICLVLEHAGDYPEVQRQSLEWLINQLARKRGITPEIVQP